jgi:thiopurine S-methyltransferase
MDKEYWFDRWQNNEIAFNQQKPNPFLLQYLKALNLKPGSNIFVPLCGKSIDMLWLREQGYKVIGVELSVQACIEFYEENNLAFQRNTKKQFTALTGENITLLAGDFFELNKELIEPIDAVYDRAALVALPSEARTRYAAHISKLSEEYTQILLITASYNQTEMQGPPFSVDEDEVKILYGKNFVIYELYNEQTNEIPDHLRAKGLTKSRQWVFRLAKNE